MKLVFRERILIVADTMMKVIKETNSQSRNLKKKFKEECIEILSQHNLQLHMPNNVDLGIKRQRLREQTFSRRTKKFL